MANSKDLGTPGTPADNTADMIAKGRKHGRPFATVCKRGHPYNGITSYLDKKGHNVCRICTTDNWRRYEARNPRRRHHESA